MTGHSRETDLPRSIGVAILTVSDTRAPGTDSGGALARSLAEGAGHRVIGSRIVPDEPDAVRGAIEAWLEDTGCEAILVTGGTGISGRDRTCETVAALIDRRLDGYGEIFRSLSFQQIGARAMLSRAIGGVARNRPVFTMPGSPAAVRLAMEALILPALAHTVAEATRTT